MGQVIKLTQTRGFADGVFFGLKQELCLFDPFFRPVFRRRFTGCFFEFLSEIAAADKKHLRDLFNRIVIISGKYVFCFLDEFGV